MTQYIKEGPQIPEEIEEALRDGKLVFFCGAGISKSNGLPLFDELAEQVCEKLNSNINHPLLKIAKEKGDYPGLFDLLENGRIPDLSTKSEFLREKVISILNEYIPPFDIHKALLELSALPDSAGHRLVTTNFDKLFFEAKSDLKFDSAPKLILPRKGKWKNLTFLHGVINEKNDSNGENLILTKTDFGLAYLYDNWASRFVMQLFQDFTVLFIGYSADDPAMNYLVSAISYENRRKSENENERIQKPSIYAFVGYNKEGKREVEENKWKSIGVEPIPYKIKEIEDHSLLYETIKGWAKSKKAGLEEKRIWLKQQLGKPYREKTDKQLAKNIISSLKIDKRLAEHLSKINLSSDPDPKKRKPVDISWLKAFSEFGLLNKLTNRTNQYTWEPLPESERNIAIWLLAHLDKKELIHWLIEQAHPQSKLISLHPDFKHMLKYQLKKITLGDREALFWSIAAMQKDHLQDSLSSYLRIPIKELNAGYSYGKARELLLYLEPMIGFEKYNKKFKSDPDQIYKPKLKINASSYPNLKLKNELVLSSHAEDFSNLLKKAMELAEWVGLIGDGGDFFYIQRPSIAKDSQNRNYYSWTFLLDLVRDSFDLIIETDKKLAEFLISKWDLYPYSIFYRLILYAVTKHSSLDEKIVIKLFKEKTNQTLWSTSCQNEVLKFLRKREHSEETVNEIFPLIMRGPDRSLYKGDIEDSHFIELKERYIYKRLKSLKASGVKMPGDIENEYKKLEGKYDVQGIEYNDRGDFPFYHTGPKALVSKKLFYNFTNEQIFEKIKYSSSGDLFAVHEVEEEFKTFFQKFPRRAFDILSLFQDSDVKSAPYWSIFLYKISMMDTHEESKKYFLKSFNKLEKFNDDFLKECLWSLIHILDCRGSLIYSENKDRFKKWWKRLFSLSLQKKEPFDSDTDVATTSINSNLGKLSQIVFSMLWSGFSDSKIPKGGKIPEEIKEYFKIILKSECIKKDPSILFHFGSHLSRLWYLDREWVLENLKPLIDWSKTEPVCIRFTKPIISSVQLNSDPPEGVQDALKDYNICEPLWKGYLFHDRFLGPDFLEEFKKEFFHLLLNYKKLLNDYHKMDYTGCLAETFFIITGGSRIKNIFTREETQEIVQNVGVDILQSLSRQIWYFLKDSEGKSENLWSDKIKPWIEKFWPRQTNKMNQKIAENLSFVILHCGKKLPEAFNVLKSFIEGNIEQNSDYISHYIMESEEGKNKKRQQWKGNSKQSLEYIYDYSDELLQILNWNFPGDKIHYGYEEKTKQILDKLKAKRPDIETNERYRKLRDKIPD